MVAPNKDHPDYIRRFGPAAGLCRWCGKRIQPRKSKEGHAQASYFIIHNDPEAYFCTMRCGFLYAVRTVNEAKKALGG